MSLELLSAERTADGIAATFATERGVERLEGSPEQVARLAKAMHQVCALAPLNDEDGIWLEDVTVGNAIVRLGLGRAGEARLRILRP
jgi:hypothetical protein